MAGKFHYSVSANFCNIEADTPQELFDKLVQFNQFPGMAEQINQFSQVTSGKATTMQQAVQTVQNTMGATVIEQQPAQQVQPAQQPQGWGAQAPAQAQQMPQQAVTAPTCAHGERTPRAGNGKNGPYRAWFCNTPQGAPDKCKPIFVNQGTPEWDGFPA